MDLTTISYTATPQDKPPDLIALDADILAWHTAHEVDRDGIDDLDDILDARLLKWVPAFSTNVVACFSDSRENNFRRDHWPTYKSHRDNSAEPESLGSVKKAIKARFESLLYPRLEADDLLGILASSGTAVCVTQDKDLKQITGWHMHPDDPFQTVCFITQEEGSRRLHTQWMTGDHTDKFPGIPKVGPKKAEEVLSQLTPELWTFGVMATFESRGHSLEFALSQRACAKILTIEDIDLSSMTPRTYVW